VQLSLRPYVTAGIVLVGAGVIVANPGILAPPSEVVRSVEIAPAAAQGTSSSGLGGLVADLESTVADLAPSAAGGGTTFGGSTTPPLLLLLQLETTNLSNVLGAAPGELTTLLQDVQKNPSELPNALATVADLLFSLPNLSATVPNVTSPIGFAGPRSLLAAVLDPVVRVLEQVLPPPLGGTGTTGTPGGTTVAGNPGIIAAGYAFLASLVDGALSLLPTPLPVGTFSNTTANFRSPAPVLYAAATSAANTATVSQVPNLTATGTPSVVNVLAPQSPATTNTTNERATGTPRLSLQAAPILRRILDGGGHGGAGGGFHAGGRSGGFGGGGFHAGGGNGGGGGRRA
jgi:hypothetical protein